MSEMRLRHLQNVPRILLALLVVAACSRANAQTVTLDPPQVAQVDILTVNDLDFLNATTPKWLFTITMHSDQPVQAIMTITINIMLRDGTSFPGAAMITTAPFDIVTTRTVTNIDLTYDNPHVAEHSFRDDAKTRLEETALPGGRIPAGLYMFIVTVTPEGGSPVTVTFELEPLNPGSVELLYPPDGEENAGTFPVFQWRYDGTRSRISIYEQLPGQISPQEVISGVPQLVETVETNSFQYPTAGVRSLDPGKTYAWTIEGLAGVSGGGDAVIRSDIRMFRVGTNNAVWVSGLLDEIEKAIGPDYVDVFNGIRREGLTTNGTMSLNGNPITYTDLLHLLDHFREDQGSVKSVEVE